MCEHLFNSSSRCYPPHTKKEVSEFQGAFIEIGSGESVCKCEGNAKAPWVIYAIFMVIVKMLYGYTHTLGNKQKTSSKRRGERKLMIWHDILSAMNKNSRVIPSHEYISLINHHKNIQISSKSTHMLFHSVRCSLLVLNIDDK
jgi:hypothetical protein